MTFVEICHSKSLLIKKTDVKHFFYFDKKELFDWRLVRVLLLFNLITKAA